MKFVAKHLSKKALSCILALSLVLCSITAVFSVFANVETAEPYTVTYGSPLIPMYVNKMVNLADIEIQLEKGGEAVSATTLTWTAPADDGIIFAGNKITAASAGTYKFTVTDAEDNQYPVYVIANEAGDEKFELVSRDFSKAADRITSEWMLGKAPSANGYDASTRNVHTYGGEGVFDTGNKCLNLSNIRTEGSTAIFKSDILKDFADYTVDAKIEVRNGDCKMDRTAVGILTRVQANYDAATVDTDYVFNQETSPSALGVGFRPYGGAHFYYFKSTGGGNNNYTSYTNRTFDEVTTYEGEYVFGGYYSGTASSQNDVTIKAAGTDVGYWLNGNMVLDTTAADSFTKVTTNSTGAYSADLDTSAYTSETVTKDTFNSSVASNFCTDRGTIGFYRSRVAALRVYSFTVSANVTSMPKMSAPDFYTVDSASPAIPMFAGKLVALSDIALTFDGKLVLGSNEGINWSVTDGTNVALVNGGIYAITPGITTLTAEYNGTPQKVYVIANEAGNTNFHLVDLDLTTAGGDYNAADWVLQLDRFTSTSNYGNGGEITAINAYSGNTNQSVSSVTDSEGNPHDNDAYATSYYRFIPKVTDTGIALTAYNAGSATLLYKSEILKDFADYTVSVNVKNGNNEPISRTYFSVVARATVNEAMPTVSEAIVETETITNSSNASQTLYTFADGLREQINGVSVFDTSSTALKLITHRYGGLAINAMESTGKLLGTTVYDTFYTNSNASYENEESATTTSVKNDTGYVASDSNYAWGYNIFKTLEYKLEGNRIVYSLKNESDEAFTEIFDSAKIAENIQGVNIYAKGANNEAYISEIAELPTAEEYDTLTENLGKGTVGFSISRAGGINVKSLKVLLNNTTMPKMSDADFYTVDSANPVIPMTAGYKLSTSDFMMSVNGVNYPASSFSWTGGSDTTAEVKDGYLCSYSKGGTVLNGTHTANSDITAKLYVVAKESGDTEYTVYSNDYRSTINQADVSDWKTVVVNGNDVDTGIDVSVNSVTVNYANEQNLKGFVPYNFATIKTDSDLTSSTGSTIINKAYTLLDNEIVNSLTDYKITASFRMYSGNRGLLGVVGRVSDTTDGKYTAGSSKTYGFATAGNNCWTNAFKKIHAINENALATPSDVSADLKNYLQASITSNGYDYRTFVLEFKDETATLSAPGIDGTATFTAPEQAGQVGFVAMFTDNNATTPVLMDFAVTLTNVNDEALSSKLVLNGAEVVSKAGGYVDNGNYYFVSKENGALDSASGDSTKGYYIYDEAQSYSEKVTILSENAYGYTGNVWNTGHSLFSAETAAVRQSVGEIVLSDGYTTINGHAFKNMPFLEKFTVPSTLTIISDNAFNTSGLTEIVLPDTVTTIEHQVFLNCRSLRKVELGNGIKWISYSVFQNCTALQEIVLPESCLGVGNSAFAGDIMLKDLYVYNPETTFGTSAVPATTTIHGYIGSEAHAYALANGNEFVPLDNLTVNSRITLPAVDGFTWTAGVVAGDTAAIVGLGEGKITVSGVYTVVTTTDNGDGTTTDTETPYEFSVALTVGAYDAANENNFINTDKITIVPTANDGIYNLVIANDVNVKHDAFTIDGNVAYLNETDAKTGKEYLLYTVADATGKNKQYSLATIEIAAEFEADETYSSAIYALGATVPTDKEDIAIRFVNRITAITAANGGGAIKESISVNGTAVKPVAVGSLVIPTMLINSDVNNLVLPEDADLASYIDDDAPAQVSVGNYNAANVAITKLNDATADYSDYVVKLKNIGSMINTDITCRSYIIYQNADNSYGIIYDADIIRNYSQVFASANAQ